MGEHRKDVKGDVDAASFLEELLCRGADFLAVFPLFQGQRVFYPL